VPPALLPEVLPMILIVAAIAGGGVTLMLSSLIPEVSTLPVIFSKFAPFQVKLEVVLAKVVPLTA
jgi:hypothetical protein